MGRLMALRRAIARLLPVRRPNPLSGNSNSASEALKSPEILPPHTPPPNALPHISAIPPADLTLPALSPVPPIVAVSSHTPLFISPPALAVHCLGQFRVYCNNQSIQQWHSKKGKNVFKYLVAHPNKPIARDILMEHFWPEADPASARNNLNVAMHGLRQVFKAVNTEYSFILYEDEHYCINPAIQLWIDFEQFTQHYEAGMRLERSGKFADALAEYEKAINLYQDDFLEEDIYEDWLTVQRERLRYCYLDLLDRASRYYWQEQQLALCIYFCQKILQKDNCREDVHRRLMQCYVRQGQPFLALHQYQICAQAMKEELDILPEPATVNLYKQLCEQKE